MNKSIIALSSLASLLLLSKPALAESMPSWLDGFNIGGYSTLELSKERKKDANISLNEISLLITWNGNSRWRFFSELELENPLSFNTERKFYTQASSVETERIYFDYNLSERVNIRAGRFLTPNSRWNLLHASPLVWTGTRPTTTTRLFPTGTNGIMLFGAMPYKHGAFEYKLFAELLEDQETLESELKFEHVKGARFSYKSQSDVGISLLSFKELADNGQADKNSGESLLLTDTSYRMLGLDFVTHVNDIEVSGEAFQRFNTKNKDGGSGAYLQTAVPLNNIGLNNWYWITRLESFKRPYERASERWLIGATWRVKPRQLFKIEFTGGSGHQPGSPRGFSTSFAMFF